MMRFYLRSFLPLMAVFVSNSVFASPRLLQAYPSPAYLAQTELGLRPSTLSDSSKPIGFAFSEAMDASKIVLPNATNSNPDRSFEILGFIDYGQPTQREVPFGSHATGITTRENGRIVEFNDSRLGGAGAVFRIHLFRNGFRNLKGEPLDRDYSFIVAYMQLPLLDRYYRFLLPAEGEAVSNPSEPISIYFPFGLPPQDFEVQLLTGYGGTPLGPLTDHWDMEVPNNQGGGFSHLTIDHPPLTPSPRPYLLQLPDFWVKPTGPENILAIPYSEHKLHRITIGPALAGDLNNDGYVTPADALLALRGAIGTLTLSDAQTFAADLMPGNGSNGRSIGDGKVDTADVLHILRRSVGLIPDPQWP
jgi:hypothetical protein